MSLRYMEMLKTSFHAATQEINFAQSRAAAEVRLAKPDSSIFVTLLPRRSTGGSRGRRETK